MERTFKISIEFTNDAEKSPTLLGAWLQVWPCVESFDISEGIFEVELVSALVTEERFRALFETWAFQVWREGRP